jgi:hypothetical protein
MKKTLIISALLAGSISAYSQGTVFFGDSLPDVTIHIFAPQGAEVTGDQGSSTPGVSTGGVTTDIYLNNTTDGNYAGGATAQAGGAGTTNYGGSTVYTGGAIGNTFTGNPTAAGAYNYNNGKDYSVELYAAPGLNAPASALQPVTQYLTIIVTSSTVGGTFKSVTPASDPGISGTSASATIALVAWYNGGGTYTTYAAALAAGVPTGESPLDNLTALGNPAGSPPVTAPDLQGLESFSLALPIPEPSTVALGVIGASTLLFRRRKK